MNTMKILTTATGGILSSEAVNGLDIDTTEIVSSVVTTGADIVSTATTVEAVVKILTQIVILSVALISLLRKKKEQSSTN